MTKDLAGPVADQTDRTILWLHYISHRTGDLKHRDVTARAEVDRLTYDALRFYVQQPVERFAMVFDEHEVARGRPVAVNRQRLAQDATGDETRHDLFKMLVGAVVVKGADDDGGDFVGRPVRVDQPVGPALGGGVGTHRIERVVFAHLPRDGSAVDFRCRDVDEALYTVAVFDDRVGDRLRSQNVSLEKQTVVVDRARDVRLRSHMNHYVPLRDQSVHQLAVAHVA